MIHRGALVLLAAGLAGPAFAQEAPPGDQPAGDVAAGRKIAAGICQSCHGMDGLAKLPEMPTIAAADATYLTRQLDAFRSGERKNEMMSVVAPMLDDKKITDVSAYYAAIKVTAQLPPK